MGGKGRGDLEMSECQDKEKEKLSKLLLSSVHNKVNSHNITMGGHLITFCSPYHYYTCHNFYSTVQLYSCELASSPFR